MHTLLSVKIFFAILLFVIALVSGFYPFMRKLRSDKAASFPMAEAFAAGVFLGAGLLHMLSDANQQFTQLGYQYPFAALLAGSVFLALLVFEHICRELHEHKRTTVFALLAMVMLSVHSFLAGAALGMSGSWAVLIVILIAILAHKWAAGFALSVEMNKSGLSFKVALLLFLIFALMTPLGILLGALVHHQWVSSPLIQPILIALAAGTFLYLGTLHGLKTSVLVEGCCGLNRVAFVLIGFAVMGVLAVYV